MERRNLVNWLACLVAIGGATAVSAQSSDPNTSTSSDMHESCTNLSLSTDRKTLKGDCNKWSTNAAGARTFVSTEKGVSLTINDRVAYSQGEPGNDGELDISAASGGGYASACPSAGLSMRTTGGIDLDATCTKTNCPVEGEPDKFEECDVNLTADLSADVQNGNGTLAWK